LRAKSALPAVTNSPKTEDKTILLKNHKSTNFRKILSLANLWTSPFYTANVTLLYGPVTRVFRTDLSHVQPVLPVHTCNLFRSNQMCDLLCCTVLYGLHVWSVQSVPQVRSVLLNGYLFLPHVRPSLPHSCGLPAKNKKIECPETLGHVDFSECFLTSAIYPNPGFNHFLSLQMFNAHSQY